MSASKERNNMMQLFYQDTSMFALIVEKMSKFQTQLIEQQKEITLLKGDAATKDKTIEMLQKSLQEEKSNSNEINQLVLTSISPSLNLVKEVIEKHQINIDTLSTSLAETTSNRETLNAKVDSNTQAIQSLRDNVKDSIESISKLDERYTSQLTNVSGNITKNMIVQMDTMNQELEKLKLSGEGNEKTIESITDTLTGHSKNLTEINVLMGNQKTSMEVQGSKISSLGDLLDTLNQSNDANQKNLMEAQELQKRNMEALIQTLKQELIVKIEESKGENEKAKASFATHDYVDDKMKRFLHDEIDSVSRKSTSDMDLESMRKLFTPLDQFHKKSLELNTKLEEMKQSILSNQKFDDIKETAMNHTKQEIDSLKNLQEKQLDEHLELFKKKLDTDYVPIKDFDNHLQYCEETFMKKMNQSLLVTQDQLNTKIDEATKFMKENYMNALTQAQPLEDDDNNNKVSSQQMTIINQQFKNVQDQVADISEIMGKWQERIQQNYEDIGDLKGNVEALVDDFNKFKQEQLTLNVEVKAHFEKLDNTNAEQEKRWNEFHNFHWRFVDKKVTRIDKDIKRIDEDLEQALDLSDRVQEIGIDMEHLEKSIEGVDVRVTNTVKTMNNNFRSLNDNITRLKDYVNNQSYARAVTPISLHTDSSPNIILEPVENRTEQISEQIESQDEEKLSIKYEEDGEEAIEEEDDVDESEAMDTPVKEDVDESEAMETPVKSEEQIEDDTPIKQGDDEQIEDDTPIKHGDDDEQIEDGSDDEEMVLEEEEYEEEEHELEVLRLSSHHWFHKGANLIVDDSVPNHVFRQGGNAKWQSAHTREEYDKGAYIWTIKISDFDENATSLVGVCDPSQIDLDKQAIGTNDSSWAISIPDCKVHHNGKVASFEGIKSLEKGDELYIFLNIDDGTISFAKERNDLGNEENIGFENIQGTMSPSVSIGNRGVCSLVFV
mmetsp:Transcript_7744/g.11499  ORF Transcript_7744/g.11499 Transcript_7744/m.11499 type:complete len:948 (-) Transcript_7744:1040-3883(-)|eukprot:CAMPEP_0117423970 /NCGR_PEP_ID=MMETSP0758-20121206/4491_1 /TAXON_ID=63605 /ORGANISM="Percolomonas cosmopolitus, Strain AE-1 (ATCC 50343)" /LENGTH=947 /DNA_ID=CAMNT_0005207485 /DNA_START=72 /DNA_END=2915 /DNA_ORIENTATION=-